MNDSRPGPLLAPLHASTSPSHHLLLLPHSQPQQQQQHHLLLPDTGGPGPDGVGPAAPALSRATLAACTLLLALLFCVGTYGNLVVFLSFFDPSLRKLRTHFDFLVLNLSFCDLFVSCATAPMLGSVLLVRHWARGAVSHSLCFSLQLTAAAFPLLSLQTVSVIAVQRLRLVLGQQPSQAAAMLVSHASSASALLLSLLLWALGLILAALAALRGHTRGPGPGPQLCLPLLSGGLVLYAYAADFLLCLVVLTVSYALIAHALRLKARVRKGAIITVDVAPGAHPGAGERPCAPDAAAAAAAAPCAGATRDHGPGPADDPASRMRGPGLMATAKDSKALLTCLVIALSALACCMPLSVALLQGVMSAGPNGGVASTQLEVFGYTLLFLKSGLNPFLYSRSGAGLWKRLSCCLRALSAPLLGVCTCCTCCSSCCCCCRPKTRLRAVGRGNLSANCAKSSHHDTNSACILSPKRPASTYDRPHHHHHHHHHRHHRHQQQQQQQQPQPPGPRGGRVDQACGPSLHSLQAGAEGRRGPGSRSERRPFAHSASSPINSRVEPYYSIYNSSPSPPSSPGGSVQHQRRGQHPRRGQRGASGCVCAAPALTELLMEPERPADRNMIPLPSV